MAFNIYDTHTFYGVVQGITPKKTFLRDRYFPTTGVFNTKDVIFDFKSDDNKLAPFVIRKKGGVTIDRDGYQTRQITPPYIAPRTTITVDDLEERGFGEALFSQDTPEQRALRYLLNDESSLDEKISAREEWMCAQMLLNNKVTMQAIADKTTEYDELELKFYEGTDNPGTYTPAASWASSSANIINDLYAMVKALRINGNMGTELIVGGSVMSAILNNEAIMKLLDNRRIEVGDIMPTLNPQGVSALGTINAYGNNITVLGYDFGYTATDGTYTNFIPDGYAILTAPSAGQRMYGAITQIEQEDRNYHTRAGARVPKIETSIENDTRTLTLKSAPVVAPKSITPWVSAKVIF